MRLVDAHPVAAAVTAACLAPAVLLGGCGDDAQPEAASVPAWLQQADLPSFTEEPPRPPATPLVELTRSHAVRSAPRVDARRTERVSGRRPYTRVRTVLPVLDTATSSDGRRWLRVRLPGRPNGHAGWITADRTRAASTDWHVRVRLKTRLVTVYRAGRLQARFRGVIGMPSAPTPRGRFFVEEVLKLTGIGRPYAVALSSRSGVYKQFAGGPGQVAFHGTTGIGGRLGSAVSHGCIRLTPKAITWLAKRVKPGVPVTVSA